MSSTSHRHAGAVKRRRGLSVLSATALAAGTIVGGATPALTAPDTFNPFDVNNGFTIVSPGDVHLDNGEIEGSVATMGTISSGDQNGYPVVHHVAGQADYTVPTIDGTPVRILAGQFIGDGSFEVTNAGAPDVDSPEANAVVKLADIDNLEGEERGGFFRITNNSEAAFSESPTTVKTTKSETLI